MIEEKIWNEETQSYEDIDILEVLYRALNPLGAS